MARLMNIVQNIWKAKNFAKVMQTTLDSLRQILTCNVGIMVVVEQSLLNKDDLRTLPDLLLTQQYVENKEIQVVVSANGDQSGNHDPAFYRL